MDELIDADMKRRYWIVILFVLISALFVLIRDHHLGVLYYSVRISFHNIYQEMEAYDDTTGHLPEPAAAGPGNPEMSWRVAIVAGGGGWWGKRGLNNRIGTYDVKKTWDDPANLRLDEFLNYNDMFGYEPRGRHRDVSVGNRKAYFKVIVGPNTAFEPGVSRSLKDLPDDLILVVRVEESDVHWMQPGDLKIENFQGREPPAKNLLLGSNGYAVLFADGKAWVLSERLPFSDLKKFITISDARRYDRDALLGPYRIVPQL